MNLDVHHLILFAIAAVALLVWLAGLLYLININRRTATPGAEFWEDDPELETQPGQVSVRGSAEVVGKPADLSPKAAAQLAQHGLGQLGPVKILDQSESRVLFEGLSDMRGRVIGRGVLEFQPVAGDRTRILYTVKAPQRSGLLVAAWLVQALGLIALVIGFVVLLLWVAPHPHPAVRWQSVQMVHILHFLWPPFLLCILYRRAQKQVRTSLDGVVHNLPYLT